MADDIKCVTPMRSPVKRATNGASRVLLHRLPQELLLTILVECLDQEQSLRGIATLSLVCHHWSDLVRNDFVWSYVAKHYFVAFPLLRTLLQPSPAMPAAPPVPGDPVPPLDAPPPRIPSNESFGAVEVARAAAAAAAGYRVLHRRSVSREEALPTKTAVMASTMAVRAYIGQRQHAHRIAQRRRYVLHMFVSFCLFFVFMSLTCFICAFENVGPTAGAVENGLNFAWGVLVLVEVSIITNLIMQAHFEPNPLFRRISNHFHLIAKSVAVLAAGIFVVGLPGAMLHYNLLYAASRQDMYTATALLSPVAVSAAVWELHVLVRFRRPIVDWARGNLVVTPRGFYNAFANMTPLFVVVSCASAVSYVEGGGGQIALIAGSIVPLIACSVLGFLFATDFVAGANAMDGLASLSLFVAAGAPLMLALGVVRGYSLAPVAIASALFFLGHATHLLKLLHTVDELDVLVAAGAHGHDD